jgi:hypothetical protein
MLVSMREERERERERKREERGLAYVAALFWHHT